MKIKTSDFLFCYAWSTSIVPSVPTLGFADGAPAFAPSASAVSIVFSWFSSSPESPSSESSPESS